MTPRLREYLTDEKLSQNGYDAGDYDFLKQIGDDFSQLRFTLGRKYAFRPPKTIVIGPSEPFWKVLLLHEVGHAICKHNRFRTDVERLKMENQAWEEARKLAITYNITMGEDIIQRELDSYRDWLHQKSCCPDCGLTRFQTPDGVYHCPRCNILMKHKK